MVCNRHKGHLGCMPCQAGHQRRAHTVEWDYAAGPVFLPARGVCNALKKRGGNVLDDSRWLLCWETGTSDGLTLVVVLGDRCI